MDNNQRKRNEPISNPAENVGSESHGDGLDQSESTSTISDPFVSTSSLNQSGDNLVRPKSLEDLPNEIVVQIFDYLPIDERVPVGRVSKRWQDCMDASLRTETYLSNEFWDRFKLPLPPPLLERMKKVKTIHFYKKDRLEEVSQLSAKDFPELTALYVTTTDLHSNLLEFKNLRKLALVMHKNIDPERFSSLFRKIIDAYPCLTSLVILFYEPKVEIDHVNLLFEGCVAGTGKSLRTLWINPLPGDAAQTLVDTFPNLEELGFYNPYQDDNFDPGFDILPIGNLRLRLLELDGIIGEDELLCRYQPSMITRLLQGPLAESLETLNLRLSIISEPLLSLNLLTTCHDLKVLELELNGESPLHRSIFNVIARNFPKLQELLLDLRFGSWFTNQPQYVTVRTVQYVTNDHFDFPPLRRLRLRGEGASQFVTAVLQKCQSLEFFGLYDFEFKIGDWIGLLGPSLEKYWSGNRRFLDLKVNGEADENYDGLQNWNLSAAAKGLCARLSFWTLKDWNANREY